MPDDTHTENYDAIVIGSGLGGLTAAALCAKAGQRVLVLERNHEFGGAASVYQRGALSIEASLHETTDPHHPRALTHKVFEKLGILDDLEYIPVPNFYEARSPLFEQPFVLPHSMEKAKQALKDRFPQHKQALDIYFNRIDKTFTFVRLFGEHHGRWWWILNSPMLLVKFWPVFRHMKKSLAQVLDELFGDDEAIKLALAVNLGYYADDPAKMWWYFFAIAQGGYLTIGGYYIKGGSKALTDRLVKLINDEGGTTTSSRLVTRILLDDAGCVFGVEHEARAGGDQQTARTATVFGSAAPHVLATMLPEDKQTDFMQLYNHKSLSLSLFSIYLGLDKHPAELGIAHYNTFLVPDWLKKLSDYRDNAALLGQAPGERLPGLVMVDYSCIDSGLNQLPPYLVTVAGVDRLENWSSLSEQDYHSLRDQWQEAIIARIDQEFPGFADAIVQKEMVTALSMHRYLNTPGGAVYGFAPEPPKRLLFRGRPLNPKTSIKGLWLTSAYASVGGYTGTILAGAIAARRVLNQ